MKTEKALVIIFLIGLTLKLSQQPGGSVLFVVTLSALSIIYFPLAFYFFSDKAISRQNLPLSIISGLGLSILSIGILFKLQYWPGASITILTGIVASLATLGFIFYFKNKAAEDLKVYYKNMTIRSLILCVFGLALFLTPMKTLLIIQYRDPELVKLKALYYSEPENPENKKKYFDYLNKKDSLERLNPSY